MTTTQWHSLDASTFGDAELTTREKRLAAMTGDFRAIPRFIIDKPTLSYEERKAEVRRLWPTGMPIREIAAQLEMTVTGVSNMAHRMHLPRRPRGGVR